MAWAVRRPVVALIAWLVLVVSLGIAATVLGGKPDDSFALPGVQSTTAQELLEKTGANPSTADPSGKVVWSPRSGTVTDDANQAAATALLEQIAAEPFVLCVTGPFQANYGRSCPKAQPSDLAAALDDAVVAELAKVLHIPESKVRPVVGLLEDLAPLADADPATLAAVARALPEIGRASCRERVCSTV